MEEELAECERLRELGEIVEGGLAAAGVVAAGETTRTMLWIWYTTNLENGEADLIEGTSRNLSEKGNTDKNQCYAWNGARPMRRRLVGTKISSLSMKKCTAPLNTEHGWQWSGTDGLRLELACRWNWLRSYGHMRWNTWIAKRRHADS
jgi:hypothetical protein